MAITATNIVRRVTGNQVSVTADLANITDNDTWIVPFISKVEEKKFSPTTEADYGITDATNVLTFKTSSTIVGEITVKGR